MPDNTITAKALAEELNIDGKRLRGYLRKEHSRPGEAKGTTWAIPPDVADAARAKFAKKADDAPATEEPVAEEVTEETPVEA